MKMDGHAGRFLFFMGVFLLGASVAAGRICAQTTPVNPTLKKKIRADIDNLVVNVELVNVLFTVTDRKGRLITDLQKPNFKLYEDNKLQEITNFSRETDLPLTIAVLIDTSTSITDRFKFEQEAAIEFSFPNPAAPQGQGSADHIRLCHRAGFRTSPTIPNCWRGPSDAYDPAEEPSCWTASFSLARKS